MIGLLQLVLLAGAVIGVGWLVHREERSAPFDDEGRAALEEDRPGPRPPGPPPHAARHDRPPSPAPPLVTFFLSGLLIVGAGSFLTARWIVRPLEVVSRAARALGAGDLRARTGLVRADELGEVARAFDEMAERVEQLLAAERELLANVSHELRTPVARMRVALDLAREAGPEAAKQSLAEIEIDLAELGTLIDDVMTALRFEIEQGRAERSGFALHPEEIAPGDLCARSAERFHARFPARRLVVDVVGGLPPVRVDPVLFRRVVDNLLENAHKYSPDAAQAVILRARGDGANVLFSVIDRGLGIPEADLPRVFEPFFRGERSRVRSAGGVGLGLTLARRIVEAHGGTVAVISRPGEGTTVTARVPAVPAESRARL